MQSTVELEFTQAMTDFKIMFPDMDVDVIEAVLRANQGAVDATIDQLLSMCTDNQNESLRIEMEKKEGATPSKRRSRTLRPEQQRCSKDEDRTALVNFEEDSSIPLAVQKKWAPLMLGPLPPTFLRIPQGSDVRIDLSLEMDDAKIATLLQNEEFMAELRWNQEFMAALDNEQGHKKSDEEADLKDRIKNMGKMSRKKFAQLSRMFTRQGSKRSSGAKPPTRAPPDSLLLQEEFSDDEEKAQSMRTSTN